MNSNNELYLESFSFGELIRDINSIKDNFIIKEIQDYDQSFDEILYLDEKKEIYIKYRVYKYHVKKYLNSFQYF